MAGTTWPTMTDYQEAVQTPRACFADGQLQQGTPVMNKLGLPRPICGQFASVYELENSGDRWAIKCFLRNIPDLHSRYAKIAKHLGTIELPYFMTFEYLQKGISVRGTYYPIVKMNWVEGLGLNQYLEKNLTDSAALEQLETRWLELLEDLQTVKVAHGDLQHGNVLVGDDGSLRLIDYDGMWVPKLKGQTSHETGHPDYQSPLRTGKDFHAEIDGFAGEVIQIAIRALGHDPELWQKYNNGDNLLFRRQDYLEPGDSQLFSDLRALGDEEISAKLDGLIKACGGKPKRGRPSRFFRPKRAKDDAGGKPSGRIWKAKKAKAPDPPAASAPPPSPAPPAAAVAPPKPAAPPPPPRPRPAAAPAKPPPAKTGPGGWLSDHVGGATAAPPRPAAPASPPPAPVKAKAKPKVVAKAQPAAPSPAKPRPAPPAGPRPPLGRRLLGYARVLLHLLLIMPVTAVAIMELSEIRDGSGDQATAILLAGFGLATVLGLVSILTLFVLRVTHRTVSILFMGLTVIIMLLNIFSELLTTGWSDWTGDDPLQCAMMMSMLGLSALGLVLEHFCHRLGVVTRLRLPWAAR